MNRLLLALAILLAAPLHAQTACDPATPSAITQASVTLAQAGPNLVSTSLPASNVVVLLRAPNQHSPVPFGDGSLCLAIGAGIERVAVEIAPDSGGIDWGDRVPGYWHQVLYRDCPRGERCERYNLSNAVLMH